MSHGRLIGALSSLLLFLILAFLPYSEALKCPSGGYCNYITSPLNTRTSKTVECNDACFMFECKVNGNAMAGWGCETSLRNVCPDATDDVISQLTTNNSIYHSNNNHHFYTCLNQECADKMAKGYPSFSSYVTFKVDPSIAALMSIERIKHSFISTGACKYDDTRPSVLSPGNTSDFPTGHITNNNPFELVVADNATGSAGTNAADPATIASAATLPEVSMILGWIMVGWFAVQFLE